MHPYKRGATVALNQCMGLKAKEKILIVTDKNKEGIARIFLEEADKITKRCALEIIPEAKMHGQEPPAKVAEMMKNADVALLITTKSLSHTRARKEACKKGARIASMPGITEEMLKTLDVDYGKIKRMNKKIKNIMDKGKTITVKSKNGTSLRMSITKRKGFDDNGNYRKKGSFGNLPAGEACLAPIEGTSEGAYVVDGSFGAGNTKKPIKIIVKGGYVADILGSAKIKRFLFGFKKKFRNIAELGIGTNYKARIRGIVLEDEKVMGTAHVAIGNNISFGGKIDVPLHIDGLILKPTVWIDRIKIMDNGKLQEKIFK